MRTLFLVATPIGNLADITLRAVTTIRDADIIIAEDSRVSLRLLNHLNTKKPVYTCHERTRPEQISTILEKIPDEGSAAVLTDAGTPGVSDPGGRLVEAALGAGFAVIPIPGPSAITAALSVFGKRIPGFCFLGYFPKKGKTRSLNEISVTDRPTIFYETAPRIKKTLSLILSEVGDRDVMIGRELTKLHETIYRGKISEVVDEIKEKGEFVVVINGKSSVRGEKKND